MSKKNGQSFKMSVLEANINLTIAFLLSWWMQGYVFPTMFGYVVTKTQAFEITMGFTIVSFFRQLALRRVFNWFEKRKQCE